MGSDSVTIQDRCGALVPRVIRIYDGLRVSKELGNASCESPDLSRCVMFTRGNPNSALEFVHHGQYHLHPDQIRVQFQVSLNSDSLHRVANESPSTVDVTPFLTTRTANRDPLYALGDEEEKFVPIMRLPCCDFWTRSRPGLGRFGVDPRQGTRSYAERSVPPIIRNDLPIYIVKRDRIV